MEFLIPARQAAVLDARVVALNAAALEKQARR
jgi:hypothetical protein